MAQEFTIKSQQIEDKINQLLPSQGGFQPGVDFSASTMVIPIVDLTETAEGSSLRQDLQRAQSLSSATTFSVTNTTSTLVNTTGYYNVKCSLQILTVTSGTPSANISVTDGVTTKILYEINQTAAITTRALDYTLLDFDVFLRAGESLTCTSSSTATKITGSLRQIADINGNLVNP